MTEEPFTKSGLNHNDWQQALKEEQVLLGQECTDCGRQTATPKAACNRCGCLDLRTIQLPTTGVVYTETKVATPPAGFEEGYTLAIVELAEARVLVRIQDKDGVNIGDDVELLRGFEHGGDIVPLFGKTDPEMDC